MTELYVLRWTAANLEVYQVPYSLGTRRRLDGQATVYGHRLHVLAQPPDPGVLCRLDADPGRGRDLPDRSGSRGLHRTVRRASLAQAGRGDLNEMRYRLLASYQGAPYEAGVGPAETGVVLFAACPPPEDLGFEPATGHWRKQVDRIDVQTLYESRPVGMFRGERCVVLDELTDRLHIAYLGHDAYRAEQLGYWEVDRGVFELITPRQEVTEIVEQRLAVAALGDSTPYPAPAPMPAGFGYDAEQANGSRPHLPPSDLLAGLDPLGSDHPPLDDYLQEFPQYGGPGGRRPDERRPNERRPSDLGQPQADAPPLPLEAEAMRAASAAARKAKRSQPAPGDSVTADGTASDLPVAGISSAAMTAGATPPAPTAPLPTAPGSITPVSTAPAGLSEPSSAPPDGGEGASAVPSWTPQPVGAPTRSTSRPPAPQPRARSASAGHGAARDAPADGAACRCPDGAVARARCPRLRSLCFDDAAIHGVPLPAPASAPRNVPPSTGQFSAAPVPGQLSQVAPGMPSLTSQPGVNLQRGASAPTARPRQRTSRRPMGSRLGQTLRMPPWATPAGAPTPPRPPVRSKPLALRLRATWPARTGGQRHPGWPRRSRARPERTGRRRWHPGARNVAPVWPATLCPAGLAGNRVTSSTAHTTVTRRTRPARRPEPGCRATSSSGLYRA